MIRDTRLFIATQVVGLLACIMSLTLYSLRPPTNELFPAWLLIGAIVVALFAFIYNIFMKATRRPMPLAFWARNKTDRQLWTIKGSIFLGLLAIVAGIMFLR